MGLIRTATRTAVASSVHGRVERRQRERWSADDQRAGPAAPPPQAAPPPPAAPPGDRLERLKSLGELRAAGVLTDAEFELEKARILQA